jgi:electron transport complex protein RnfC
MRLMPLMMYQATFSGNNQEMRDTNLMDCIECGCCAYSCPACVPLVLAFRSGKHHLRSEMKK